MGNSNVNGRPLDPTSRRSPAGEIVVSDEVPGSGGGGATALGQLTDVDAGVAPTLGNLLVGDGSVYDDLPVGADGDALIANSGEALGLRYRTPDERMFPLILENPISADDIPRYKTIRPLLVTRIVALKIGGGAGTFDWEVRYSASANDVGAGTLLESDAGVSNNTTGVTYLPPFDPGDPAIIPANNYFWLELANVSTGLSRPVAVEVFLWGVEQA